ncbi:hypothetical protein CH63R_03632 [Colletotrichum higginsianum IMI 349063]|uniref:Transposase n=1 Tax=Colletotrichum higginsianum (strain IMI 349063) TaxID=759273 RepID=A0A1B7YH02_COLHI|nr:hypothetical protein CH63R_03632 [Colletotrichum higginsianum IMI 349063]OBR11336.1 hypothetical protein CH63R_03632 [Colletotrichum higginsianum IMI 349063]
MDLSISKGSSFGRPVDCHTKQLTDPDRVRIRTLFFDAHLNRQEISRLTGFTISQVKQALRSSAAAAQPRSGRPPALSHEQEEDLVEYVTSSQQGRLASFLQLSVVLFNGAYGEDAIRSTLRRLGYRRYVARQKPLLSEATREKRLAWALAHVKWPLEEWKRVIWTDETWVLGGNYRKVNVTRKPEEELDPTCIIQRPKRKQGWMFWGSFAGSMKGPGTVWDMKSWGTITVKSYQQHIVPLIHRFISLLESRLEGRLESRRIVLMQDGGAPSHSVASTLEELASRGIEFIDFPPCSPDLNPIEPCWCWMKEYIQHHFGHRQQPSRQTLYSWVQEAWDALPEEYCGQLLESMGQRCQAVIEANGGHTSF